MCIDPGSGYKLANVDSRVRMTLLLSLDGRIDECYGGQTPSDNLKGHCTVMSKRIHQSDLPSTDEIVEPLRKLLDFLKQAGDKDEDWRVPQYVAVEKLLSEHPKAHEFLWCIDVAIKEQQYGPMPRFSRQAHPRCDDLEMSINKLKELAATGTGHNDELRYQETRNHLLVDPEIAARAPASLRTAISLKAFQEKINLAMGDCGDAVEKSTVIYDEFRHLLEWIQGDTVTGSPEWIARHAWFVKSSSMEIFNRMLDIGQIREAVMANVHPRARSLHWDRFIETEFSDDAFLVRALDIARRTWDMLRFSNTSSKQQQPAPEQKVRAAKRKTSSRASRR
jgi:hypothetical protein